MRPLSAGIGSRMRNHATKSSQTQIVRTYNELNHTAPLKGAQSILNGAATTVNYAPMLSVLFLGTRMRALQLSGKPAFLEHWNFGASGNNAVWIDWLPHGSYCHVSSLRL